MKKYLSLLLLLSGFISYAQNTIRIKGTVVDKVSSETLPFAYVTLQHKNLGTVTNANGVFELEVPTSLSKDSIRFSYLGYNKKLLPISDFINKQNVVVQLELNVQQINAVTIKPTKAISLKALLRKVNDRIPRNYTTDPIYLEGYYRETIQENGKYIKFSDAAVKIHYGGYTKKKQFKWKEYANQRGGTIGSLSIVSPVGGERLHRIHFANRTLKDDQVHVIESRSSLNFTQTDMNANIEGGPLSLMGRDRVKFKESFLDKKKYKRFDFQLGETTLDDLGWVYVVSFKTKITKGQLDSTDDTKSKRWMLANTNKLLQGKIYINQKDYAIVGYECSVPNELKQYFCGYKSMAIKHFDYKLNARYEKVGDKYYLKYIKHSDEFIYKDTIKNSTVPYIAESVFWRTGVQTDKVQKIKLTDNFSNVDANQLYDLPLEYDSTYWVNYTKQHAVARIGDSIRADMENNKKLEKQFHDKHLRNNSLKPPIALIKPSSYKIHGKTVVDDYAWLKDTRSPKSNKEVMDYLNAENDYVDNYFIPLRRKQRNLFAELMSRVDKEDESLPREIDGFVYQTKFTEENEYPIYLRKPVGSEEWKEILNVNELAKEKAYYSAGGLSISPSTNLLAHFENTTGSDKSIVRFKHLITEEYLSDSLKDVVNMLWIDDKRILYTKQEPKTNRIYQVKLHLVGSPQDTDSLIFEEENKLFQLSISKSKSKDYVFLSSGNNIASEFYFAPVADSNLHFKMIAPREIGHLYGVAQYQDYFYVLTNKFRKDFELMRVKIDSCAIDNWKPFYSPEKGTILKDFQVFDNYYVVSETEKMQDRIKIIDKKSNEDHIIKIKEKVHSIRPGYNPKFDTDTLEFVHSSMKTPPTIYRYHMGTQEKVQAKKQNVPFFFVNKFTRCERIWIEARDGTKIPVTLLYRQFSANKSNQHKRMFITAYGSYGSDNTPGFNHSIYSLINRGFVYAVVHVRGGSELGMDWYEGGKLMNKMNTFTDFIDATESLIDKGYAEKGKIVAQGGSAGGLLMGAVANMRPDLYKAIILDVPFVDIMNTMLDDKLPLTTLEYNEWGNPNEKKAYNYMMQYSPYDNVKEQDYPTLLFFTGINDSRVGYWEPAKMVAKLRKLKTDDNLLLLKTNMVAGHGGGSGRYAYLRDLSYKYTLLFDLFIEDFKKEEDEKDN